LPGPALRRRATARGHRPRPGQATEGDAQRRAHRRPRPEDRRARARGADGCQRPLRHHPDDRHPQRRHGPARRPGDPFRRWPDPRGPPQPAAGCRLGAALVRRPHPLTMKMLRDLWRLRAQGSAVVLLLGLGTGVLVGILGMPPSLKQARDDYYRRSLFAQAQVHLVRAPLRLAAEVARLPGVQAVDARVAAPAVLDLPGVDEPVTGRLLSLDDPFTTPVNRPWLVAGRWPRADARDEGVVNEAFVEARGLPVGAVLPATIRGGRERLRVVGIANSPEFVFVSPPGDLFPQPERYAVLWMPRRALERAADMDGAFNDLVIRLAPGQRIEALEPALESLLGRYGAQRPRGRERIPSARFLDQELQQLQTMALVIPPAFLAVAAFLLNVSVSRLVEAERSNIGLLKAFGFRPGEVARGYLGLAAILTGLGTLLGLVLGQGLGEW